MRAEIITVGDEILIGQIVDTNAVYISKSLNDAGIVVDSRISVGDNSSRITEVVQKAMERCEVVIMTGGLGPTKDDITKTTIAAIFNSRLVRNPEVENHVRTLLERRGIAFNELNRSQALVPECCTVLFNAHGTAPGMWFERDGHILVSLPGVPFEMRHLMDDEVMPRLKQRFALRSIVHRTLITGGIAESILAERIAAWEDALPPYLKLAYLPAPNIVRLRLSAYEVEGESVAAEIENRFDQLQQIIPDNIIGFETATLQERVHRLLIERGKTLAVAESCTGGKISSLFTAMAGASEYFMLGAVTYSNDAKMKILGVSPETLERYGAVSEQTAREMAEGARAATGADYAIATTGIAGPSGGSAEKPVGTVWFGVSSAEGTFAVMKNSGTDRGQVIDRAAAYAVQLLHETIIRSGR